MPVKQGRWPFFTIRFENDEPLQYQWGAPADRNAVDAELLDHRERTCLSLHVEQEAPGRHRLTISDEGNAVSVPLDRFIGLLEELRDRIAVEND